jgi:DNA sulfur modification protein DndD
VKISSIELRDFRQFRGRQRIELSTNPRKCVTLIHAENGVGKTSLLNAILWALYKKTTPKFDKPDSILNFGALADGERSAFVRVTFDFRGENYEATRHAFEGSENTKFEVGRVQRDGVKKVLSAPDTFMASVIPPRMAEYFFFDGEQAETFASGKKPKEVETAIRNMLGFDIAGTAMEDLKAVQREFRRALQTLPGAGDLAAIQKRLEELEQARERATSRRDKLIADKAIWQHQIDEIDKSLKAHANARELQQLRENYQRRLDQIDAELREQAAARVRWLAQSAPALVSRRLRETTLDFVDEEQLRGRIPSPYNEEFVKGLLHDATCVCGRELASGSPEWERVTRLLFKAANAEILNRIIQARSRISVLKSTAEGSTRDLKRIEDKEAKLLEEQRDLEPKLEDVGRKIKSIPLEEVAKMEEARETLKGRIGHATQEIGKCNHQIAEYLAEEVREKRELDEKSKKNDQARAVELRAQLAEGAQKRLEAERERYEQEARKTLEGTINGILAEVCRKDYTFSFGDDLGLLLRNVERRIVPHSSGESRLVGLLFTAALASFSRTRSNDKDAILTPGTVAPLVLDSPLGELDKLYQVSVANFVPRMADQVVLLVSSSQGDERVLEALEPYVGAEYVLVSHTRGPRGDRAVETRVIGGREYATSVYDADCNTTRIERVR